MNCSRVVGGGLTVAGTDINSIRVSCRSDKYAADKEFGGVVVWKPTPAMEARSIKPGYFHIRDSSAKLPPSGEGQVHGRILQDLCQQNPSEIRAAGGVVAGFAIIGGKMKI